MEKEFRAKSKWKNPEARMRLTSEKQQRARVGGVEWVERSDGRWLHNSWGHLTFTVKQMVVRKKAEELVFNVIFLIHSPDYWCRGSQEKKEGLSLVV